MSAGQSGTSIFDPVLCELAYRWFSPPAGLVLDPFAGGSVRGIVAAKLGRRYVGVDLSGRASRGERRAQAEICAEGRSAAALDRGRLARDR
jgi:DNA modification methylase